MFDHVELSVPHRRRGQAGKLNCRGLRRRLRRGRRQGRSELRDVDEALLRLFLQGLFNEALHGCRDPDCGVEHRDRHRLLMKVLEQHLHGSRVHERRAARQHLVEHDAERVKVTGGAGRIPHHLLGAEILRSPADHPGLGDCLPPGIAHELGDPEIEDLGELLAPLLDEEDVVRLDVPMEDPLLMRLFQRFETLEKDADCPCDGHRSVLPERAGKGTAVEELHRVIKEVSRCRTEVVQHDGMGILQRGHGLGFDQEALDRSLVAGHFAAQNLERHDSADQGLLRTIDDPHSALADSLSNHVAVVDGAAGQVFFGRIDERASVDGADFRSAGILLIAFRTQTFHGHRAYRRGHGPSSDFGRRSDCRTACASPIRSFALSSPQTSERGYGEILSQMLQEVPSRGGEVCAGRLLSRHPHGSGSHRRNPG